MPCQQGHGPLHVARLEHDFVVLGAKEVRHVLGLLAFVEAELHTGRGVQVEAAGEGAQVRSLPGRDGRDRPRVDAAAEVAVHLDVGDQLSPDGLLEEPRQLLGEFFLASGMGLVVEVEVPVAMRCKGSRLAERELHPGSGGQDLDAAEERARAKEVLEGEVLDQGGGVQLRLEVGVGEQGLDLGAEEQRSTSAGGAPVEGLDAVAIAGQEKALLHAVP